MILISHRGNINGKNTEMENHPEYIDEAISAGYDVEIDMWYVDDKLWLGHNKPQYKIEFDWIDNRNNKLWIHCKNKEAVEYFIEYKYITSDINWFWHEKDTLTLTSHRYIWVYPGKQPIKGSIAVLPEIHNDDVSQCIGICSDIIEKYK